MNFTTDSSTLYKALETVSGALPSKPQLSILECLLLEKHDGLLRLTATDLDYTIQHSIPVQFELTDDGEDGGSNLDRIAVPARRFIDTCRALPNMPVSFSVDHTQTIQLRTDQGKYEWIGYNGKDFPDPPVVEKGFAFPLLREVLRRALNKTGFATSKDPVRPAMTGMLIELDSEGLRTVTTDGHRMVRYLSKRVDAGVDEVVKAIVPLKAMTLATRIAGEEACTMTIAKKFVGFSFGHTTVTSVTIDAAFPDYARAIPSNHDKSLRISRDALVNAVHRVGLFSSTSSRQLSLRCSGDQIEVYARDVERSSEASETVECDYDGPNASLGYNATYLAEVLRALESDEIVLSFGAANRASIIVPPEQDPVEDILMLVMPVMLNTYG